VQLEIVAPGQTAPTPLEKMDAQQTLAVCQRFFETGVIFNSTYMVAGQQPVVWMPYAVPKRAAITPTFSGTAYSNGSAVTASAPSAAGFGHAWTATALGQTYCSTTFTASADL
jgi:hypothetical protein